MRDATIDDEGSHNCKLREKREEKQGGERGEEEEETRDGEEEEEAATKIKARVSFGGGLGCFIRERTGRVGFFP